MQEPTFAKKFDGCAARSPQRRMLPTFREEDAADVPTGEADRSGLAVDLDLAAVDRVTRRGEEEQGEDRESGNGGEAISIDVHGEPPVSISSLASR